MNQHEWFDLWLHDDEELARLLDSPVIVRETLHQWPLSCVQCVVTADGRQHIYKTQRGPTIEAAFYARARSDLLIPARTIYQQDDHLIMLFEYIDAPLLQARQWSAAEALRIGHDLLAGIAAVQGDVPNLYDVSGPDAWRVKVAAMIDLLRDLVMSGPFTLVTDSGIEGFQAYLLADAVLDASAREVGLVHGDLSGGNVFLLADGSYRVIDWARPIYGPAALDLATLLQSLGVDPLPQVGAGVLTMLYGLRIDWLAACAARWFPPGAATYDQQIADLMQQIAHIV